MFTLGLATVALQVRLERIRLATALRKQPFSPPGTPIPLRQMKTDEKLLRHHRAQVSTPTLLARSETHLEKVASSSPNRVGMIWQDASARQAVSAS
jgi:hypothetical protein